MIRGPLHAARHLARRVYGVRVHLAVGSKVIEQDGVPRDGRRSHANLARPAHVPAGDRVHGLQLTSTQPTVAVGTQREHRLATVAVTRPVQVVEQSRVPANKRRALVVHREVPAGFVSQHLQPLRLDRIRQHHQPHRAAPDRLQHSGLVGIGD